MLRSRPNPLIAILASLALAAAALTTGCGGGGGGGGGGGAPAVDTTPPTISSAGVTPASLAATGGTVTIQAIVSDNVAVSQVSATITKPDGTKQVIALSGSGTYTGQFTAPLNTTGNQQAYSVAVSATDSSGNTTTRPQFSFVVAVADTPPPPPAF